MYMIRIRLCGERGRGATGRGHPGKNAGKLEEKCIKMISPRTKSCRVGTGCGEKEISAEWWVGKVSDRLGGCPDNILVSLWPILQGGCQRET